MTLTTEQLAGSVARYAALTESIEMLEAERREIKRQIAAGLGVGASVDVAGCKVTVSAPARRFNLETARGFLTPEQVALATVTSLDAGKVKTFLPPILLDQAMDAGKGDPVVRIS